MKRMITYSALAAVLVFTGCASIDRDEDPPRLTVRTLIDGADRLMIRGDKVWFEHLAYELPGRWSGSDYPTTFNKDYEWKPVWNGDFSDEFEIPDEDAVLPMGIEFDEDTLKVKSNRGKGQVTIAEYPNAGNDYTLVLYLDDRGPYGPHWFDLKLYWE